MASKTDQTSYEKSSEAYSQQMIEIASDEFIHREPIFRSIVSQQMLSGDFEFRRN